MATREDFCTLADVESCSQLDGLTGATTELAEEAISDATDLIWALTGRQFGTYTETLRPDLQGESRSWIDLGRYPVVAVSEVLIDGASLPASGYWVQGKRYLRRTDEGQYWPSTQKEYLPDTEQDTFSVTVTWGTPPPGAVAAATRRLACELLVLKSGGSSSLTDRIKNVVRQGITMEVVSSDDLLEDGRTGIYEVDLAISVYNRDKNAALPAVMNPDNFTEHVGTTSLGGDTLTASQLAAILRAGTNVTIAVSGSKVVITAAGTSSSGSVTVSGNYDPEGTAAGLLATHVAAADPHPVYLTQAEASLLYDAISAASTAVSAHSAAVDPHPVYLTQAEADALYAAIGGGGGGGAAGSNVFMIDRYVEAFDLATLTGILNAYSAWQNFGATATVFLNADNTLYAITGTSPSSGTIAPATVQPQEGDLAVIFARLDGSFGQYPVGLVQFGPGPDFDFTSTFPDALGLTKPPTYIEHMGEHVVTADAYTSGNLNGLGPYYTVKQLADKVQSISIPVFPVVNVKDYGAVGNGTADDTAAIEAAVAAIPAGGGELLFPAGTYRMRRPLFVPSNTTVHGVGANSILKRTDGFFTTFVSGVANQPTFEVADASGFAVGDMVYVATENLIDWDATFGVITAIDTNTITLDVDLRASYDADVGIGAVSVVARVFPLITNTGALVDNPYIPVSSNIVIKDLTVDHNWQTGLDPNDRRLVSFVASAIHFEKVTGSLIDRCVIKDACSDGFSDQARGEAANTIVDCTILRPLRHGVHWGTTVNGGGKCLRNRVIDGGQRVTTGGIAHGLFYCQGVHNTVVQNNEFIGCFSGVASGDYRTTPEENYGDQSNIVSGNIFDGLTSTSPAIEPGWNTVIVGNVLKGLKGKGVKVPLGCSNVTVMGNHFELDGANAETIIAVGGLSYSLQNVVVSNNVIIGAPAVTQAANNAFSFDNCSHIVCEGNLVNGLSGGVVFNSVTDASFTNNRMVEMQGLCFGFLNQYDGGQLRDISIETNQVTVSATLGAPNILLGSGDFDYNQCTRLVINGLGSNGSADPTASGDWYIASSTSQNAWKWEGQEIHSTTGGGHLYKFRHGVGWIVIA